MAATRQRTTSRRRTSSAKTAKRKTSTTRAGKKRAAPKRATTTRARAKKTATRSRPRTRTAGTRTATRTAQTGRATDALKLLERDHRGVEDLYEKFQRGRTDATRARIAWDICDMLTLHAEMEERFLYPVVNERMDDGGKLIGEAFQEHSQAKQLIEALMEMPKGDDRIEETLGELMTDAQHHVKEEEGEMFPKIRKTFDRDELMEMGRQMQRFRTQAAG